MYDDINARKSLSRLVQYYIVSKHNTRPALKTVRPHIREIDSLHLDNFTEKDRFLILSASRLTLEYTVVYGSLKHLTL